VTPVTANIAQALIALRDAQYHVRMASKVVSPTGELDLMVFDIEKMVANLVKVSQSVQSVSGRQ
jgi:hypothetical protein